MAPRPTSVEPFDWDNASKYLHVPILRKLFRELTDPSYLDEWDNLTEVMEWAAEASIAWSGGCSSPSSTKPKRSSISMSRFLEAFDPELRKELGVWYTPTEIVQLHGRPGRRSPGEDLQLPMVWPIRVFMFSTRAAAPARIWWKFSGDRDDACRARRRRFAGERLKNAATERVFGFEILPAPFVVAHFNWVCSCKALAAPLSTRSTSAPACI